MARAVELLGPDGPLARHLDGYEVRDGQLAMASAVERALVEDRVLICEAGTGTGKTLAYLVPAILSNKKVVVSTATRALQEQIANHDLPLIRSALGLEPRAAVMKGLANYACLRKYHEFRRSPAAVRPKNARSVDAIEQWIDETDTGDVVELAGLSEDDPVVRQVASSSETRIGAACQFYDRCFVTQMKRDAEAARLVIVNHHLFFADLALRGPHPGHVIPDYDAVVFDEAHQLEDIATTFFGVRVSTVRVTGALADAERAIRLAGLGDPLFSGRGGLGLVESARRTARELWAELERVVATREGRATLEPDIWSGPLEKRWHDLDSALEGLGAYAESNATSGQTVELSRTTASDAPSPAAALEQTARRLRQIRDDIGILVDGAPGRITWLEVTSRSAALTSSAVDLSHVFRDRVFERIPAVVMTSATLASIVRAARPAGTDAIVDGDLAEGTTEGVADEPEEPRRMGFDFLRSRVGLSDDGVQVDELLVTSPFDFAKRALLYTPDDLPSPKDGRFVPAAVERIVELVAVTDGGAFVLTTSVRSMRAIHRALKARLDGRPVYVQGDAPKGALLGRFRSAEGGVLVATMSFWEGVDVPGSALRLVVLEKLPFAVPTDPVGRARAAAIEESGGNAFMDYHVPAAAIALKQGFGRLIRTRTDFGVVALLDGRVHGRGYGARLIDALPPAGRARTMDEVRAFWTSVCAL